MRLTLAPHLDEGTSGSEGRGSGDRQRPRRCRPKTDGRASMRLRDSFLIVVAAGSVGAASILVTALTAGNRDWTLLVPLLTLSIAGSITSVVGMVGFAILDNGRPPSVPAPAVRAGADLKGSAEPSAGATSSDSSRPADAPAGDTPVAVAPADPRADPGPPAVAPADAPPPP